MIDDFPRTTLAWRVSGRFDPTKTIEVLVEARSGARNLETPPTLLADAGVENRTDAVDELIDSGDVRRVAARTEVACSNSMIESWWRVLEHHWLFLNESDTEESLRRLTNFYVAEHNGRLPHSALRGQTPDEVYFGTGDGVPEDLAAKRRAARATRMVMNRSASCRVCRTVVGE